MQPLHPAVTMYHVVAGVCCHSNACVMQIGRQDHEQKGALCEGVQFLW